MQISPNSGMGVMVENFDVHSPSDIETIRTLIYSEKIVRLKRHPLDAEELAELGRSFGTLERYYEPIYHHPDVPDVFVSSSDSTPAGEKPIGVPKTGAFWHSDYQFMPNPFDITIILPKKLPTGRRGTYFIDMARAYRELPEDLKKAAEGAVVTHTVEPFFKIRPSDVYRPLSEIKQEIAQRTPPVAVPVFLEHRHTKETVLNISEGFTVGLRRANGDEDPGLLNDLLEACGQLDRSYSSEAIHFQTYEPGDVLLWDNRCLVHRAVHDAAPGPSVSYRVTVHDRVGAAQ